jgi:hypothetical protein
MAKGGNAGVALCCALAHGRGVVLQLDEKGRLFGVNFRGEDGLDWGGLYRDAVARMIEDVFSPNFNLCLLCPNGRTDHSMNADKYLPNPRHTSPRALLMFEFLGKLVGVSMRQKLYLPFALPSIVWKQLVGEAVTMDDVRAVDEATTQLIASMKEKALSCTREEFDDAFESNVFTITGSDGVPVELLPGGFDMHVSWDTREQYIRLAERYKVHEFDSQVRR